MLIISGIIILPLCSLIDKGKGEALSVIRKKDAERPQDIGSYKHRQGFVF